MTAKQRVYDFAMGGQPYTFDVAGITQALRDIDEVTKDIPRPAPIVRDSRVRVRATGRDAIVLLRREGAFEATVRYDDKTCETLYVSELEVRA